MVTASPPYSPRFRKPTYFLFCLFALAYSGWVMQIPLCMKHYAGIVSSPMIVLAGWLAGCCATMTPGWVCLIYLSSIRLFTFFFFHLSSIFEILSGHRTLFFTPASSTTLPSLDTLCPVHHVSQSYHQRSSSRVQLDQEYAPNYRIIRQSGLA